jgi:hypothetical protein
MKNLFFAFALLLTTFSAQAQISGMSVAIAGPTTGTALSATVAVTSNFNGYGVSCALSSTGNNSNGTVLVSVTGGSANYTYDLFTGSTAGATGGGTQTANISAVTKTFSGLLGTNAGSGSAYTAKVTDNNGCVAVIAAPTVNVTAPADLTASLSAMVTDLCQTNSGSITVNIAGGVKTGSLGAGAGYDITWTAGTYVNGFPGPGAGSPAGTALANTSGTQVYTGLSGNTTYTFVVTDDNGCVVQ